MYWSTGKKGSPRHCGRRHFRSNEMKSGRKWLWINTGGPGFTTKHEQLNDHYRWREVS